MDNQTTDQGQLVKKIFIEGRIQLVSGLHIGGSNLGLAIGGVDAAVIRNPLNNLPYIPGSSLKGKMRSLLERLENKMGTKPMGAVQFGPYQDISDTKTLIPKLFGIAPSEKERITQPVSRLIIRDSHLTPESFERLSRMTAADMPYTEVKTEVVIDRITSRAMPRQLERIPAGTVFNMRIVLNLFQEDNQNEYLDKVFQSLCLVQDDYLGGNGSRGSGEIDITISDILEKTQKEYESGASGIVVTDKVDIPEDLKM